MYSTIRRLLSVTLSVGLVYASDPVTTPGGTANNVAKFSGTSTIVNSAIFENGGKVGIGTTSPLANFQVVNTPTGTSGNVMNTYLYISANPSATSSASYSALNVGMQTQSGNHNNITNSMLGGGFFVTHAGTVILHSVGPARPGNLSERANTSYAARSRRA